MKSLAISCVFAFVVAGCAGGSDTTGSTVDPTTTTESGGSTSTAAAETTTTGAEDTVTTSGRELAPDFTLELGDGGSYTLSDGARPVYLVFWAEW